MINFDSLYPKRDELSATLLDENLDFVLGCETHLDSNISDPEFLPPNYLASPARSDRNRLGGGIIVIHKSDLSVNVVRKAKDAEFLAIKVQCEGKHPLILSIAYRRPNNDLAYMDTLCSHIRETVTTFPNCAHWFCGDYNLPDIDWSDESIVGNQYSKQLNQIFLDTLQSCNLDQMVDFPTRKENILDIIFTNRPSLVHKLTQCPGISDHNTIVQAEIDCRARVHKPVKRKVHLWH